mmetsp:Transcript_15595/g.42762  ORF Transcript_15595/g.42762 Transcript_15595/m.42762 type:complete len:201 (+) Transcript_15595:121-723(+)
MSFNAWQTGSACWPSCFVNHDVVCSGPLAHASRTSFGTFWRDHGAAEVCNGGPRGDSSDGAAPGHGGNATHERHGWPFLGANGNSAGVAAGAAAAPVFRRVRGAGAAFLDNGPKAAARDMEQNAAQLATRNPEEMSNLMSNDIVKGVLNASPSMNGQDVMSIVMKNPKAAYDLVNSPIVQDIMKGADMQGGGGINEAGFL